MVWGAFEGRRESRSRSSVRGGAGRIRLREGGGGRVRGWKQARLSEWRWGCLSAGVQEGVRGQGATFEHKRAMWARSRCGGEVEMGKDSFIQMLSTMTMTSLNEPVDNGFDHRRQPKSLKVNVLLTGIEVPKDGIWEVSRGYPGEKYLGELGLRGKKKYLRSSGEDYISRDTSEEREGYAGESTLRGQEKFLKSSGEDYIIRYF